MSTPSEFNDNLLEISEKASKEESPADYRENIKKASLEEIEIAGKKSFYKLRTKWSWAIIGWISFILLFNTFIFCKIGAGVFSLKDYPWLIHEIIGVNFGQIVGMGYIVVNFLYPKPFNKQKSERNNDELEPITIADN